MADAELTPSTDPPTRSATEGDGETRLIRVFISYSQDSQEHGEKVYHLAQTLRADGIDCRLDQFVASPENWERWMVEQVEEADFVLIVCSERYAERYRAKAAAGTGLGVTFEATLILGALHDSQGANAKFHPLFLTAPDRRLIPSGLRTSYHDLSALDLRTLESNPDRLLQPGGYQTLYRLLTNQPAVLPRRLGSLKRLAPLDPPGGVTPQPASTTAGAERPDPVGTARTGGFQAPNNLPIRSTSAQRFVGRTAELQRLDDLLAPEGSRVFVTGLGGVGKSELAVQHAYDSLERYPGGILRLDAHQGLSAMASQVVAFFRGAFPRDTSPTDLLPFCGRQWPAATLPPEPVLLLLDDHRGDQEGYAVERQLCEGLPPRFRRLITQRETGPTGAQGIDLPLLRRGAALDLLMFQAGTGGNERIAAEDDAADGLCQEVGDLPLALVLLGARLAGRPDLPLALLLEELKAKGTDAKALRQAHPELGAKRGVVEALLLSWEPLSEASKSLALLLGEMAAAVIPWQLVEACRLPGQPVEEGSAFGDQQAELLHAQLLERSGEGLDRLHPLVRQFFALQGRERPEETALWRKQLAAAMAAICRERIPQTHTNALVEELEVVLPHLQRVAEDFAGELSEEDVMAPYTGMGRLAEHQAVFTEALKWYELGVQKCEEKLGPEHPSTTAALNNLAQVLQATNRLEEAEPLNARAFFILRCSLGLDHPNTQKVWANRQSILQAQGLTEPEIQAQLSSLQSSTSPP